MTSFYNETEYSFTIVCMYKIVWIILILNVILRLYLLFSNAPAYLLDIYFFSNKNTIPTILKNYKAVISKSSVTVNAVKIIAFWAAKIWLCGTYKNTKSKYWDFLCKLVPAYLLTMSIA